jgi:S1-C subfamily serine protease
LQPGGPAEIAGMKVGDTIIAMAGKSINTRDQLREEIARMSVGSEVDVKVLRENEEVELKIVIGRKP